VKHNVILRNIEKLEGDLDSLGSLISRMEDGATDGAMGEAMKSDADVRSLASFLNNTPEKIVDLSKRVQAFTARINDVIQEDGKEKKIEN